MMTVLTEDTGGIAPEEGTYILTAAFFDADDEAVTPKSAEWTLTDEDGNIKNTREDIEIGSGDLDTTVDIVLSGDDLAIGSNEQPPYYRFLTVKAIYDAAEGSDLPLNDQCRFQIGNLVAVP